MEGDGHSDDEPVLKNPRKFSPIIVSRDDYRPMLSDDDDAEDTNDSLDIKPPQAAVHHHKNKNKKNREKHLIREVTRREHGYPSKSDVVPHRKSHHHSREHREHREERIREKRHHRQRHEEMRENKREREQRERDREHADMGRNKEKIIDRGGERIIEDLREKLMDKRREEGERRSKHDKKDRERERRMEEEQSHTPPPMKETPKEKSERLEREQRREKLLEAEREMMRQKEVYRRELEARRERRHLEKAQERTLREIVKKRGMSGSKDRKRKKTDENQEISDSEKEETTEFEKEEERMIVTLSDGSDEEIKPMKSPDLIVEDSDMDEDDHNDQKTPRRPDDSTEDEIHDEDVEEESESSTDTEECDEGETDDTDRHDSPEHRKNSNSEVEEDSRKSVEKEVVEHEEKASENATPAMETDKENKEELKPYYPALQGCRSVEEFQCLNRIEEGTYGVVYRARDKRTDEIVALKRLKMEKEKEGFPITSLREINTLLKAQHDNIVTVREIVVGSNMDKIFIVMNYVEHDLKSLMETMKQKKQAFIPGEVKCLMQQLLRAVAHLHDNWILHRDLKTSNLLLSHKGILKVGDFGLAREYGSPLKPYTPIVVTLWYRAPELLLGVKEYSTHVDMWSVGCIFGELLTMEALFPGKSDVDQLNRIFKELGTPNERIWPGYNKLPAVQKMTFTEYPVSQLRQRFGTEFTDVGMDFMNKFLTYNPKQRVTAEDGLRHPYFEEAPLPIDPAMFPTWPAKSELGHRKALAASPKPPPGGAGYKQLTDTDEDVSSVGFHMGSAEKGRANVGAGFSLKF